MTIYKIEKHNGRTRYLTNMNDAKQLLEELSKRQMRNNKIVNLSYAKYSGRKYFNAIYVEEG